MFFSCRNVAGPGRFYGSGKFGTFPGLSGRRVWRAREALLDTFKKNFKYKEEKNGSSRILRHIEVNIQNRFRQLTGENEKYKCLCPL